MKRRLQLLAWAGLGLFAVGACWAAVSAISAASQSSECKNHLRGIAFAICMYSRGYEAFPYGTISDEEMPPEKRLSWMAELYRNSWYSANVALIVDPAQPWDAEFNLNPKVLIGRVGEGQRQADARVFTLCTCPSNHAPRDPKRPNPSSYVGISGLGKDAALLPTGHPRAGLFGYERSTGERDVTDGLAATMAVAETAIANGPWTAGGSATVRGLDPSRTPYIGRGRQFGGTHHGGLNVAFADGSVRFLSETMTPKVFEAISTIAGGEQLPHPWDR